MIRVYEYGHEHVRIRRKKWNNKEIVLKINMQRAPVVQTTWTFCVILFYYEFSLLHIFSLVLQPWMSAYIRKTDGVYISVPQKRLKHGRQNITLHWINGIIRNNKCILPN